MACTTINVSLLSFESWISPVVRVLAYHTGGPGFDPMSGLTLLRVGEGKGTEGEEMGTALITLAPRDAETSNVSHPDPNGSNAMGIPLPLPTCLSKIKSMIM
jgi:hypothetical protein